MRKRDCNFCGFWRTPKKNNPASTPPIPITNYNVFRYRMMDFVKNEVAGKYKLISSRPFYEIQALNLPQVSEYSWKLHISLQEYFDNIEKAWDEVIWPMIMEYGIMCSKIIQGPLLREEKGEGNVVTIYLYANPELKENHSKLCEFVNRVEFALRSLDVTSGGAPPACERIKGSQYIFFRCDTPIVEDKDPNLDLPYMTPEQAIDLAKKMNSPAYNPANHPDPYRLLEICINEEPHIEEEQYSVTILSSK